MHDENNNRPNVLLICTDHWSGLLTPWAGHTAAMTPTLEQLSRNGISFTNAYSACPMCIPARRSLMTGMSARSHRDRIFKERERFPDVPTLAGCFKQAGYQAFGVGKMHVYPQRDRIGFDDIILEEQGRHHLGGGADDYELFLAEQGYAGREYATGMAHNDLITRPWHLPEYCHPINWAVREMCRTIHRRDRSKSGFWYISFSAPHPPLTPLREYMDLYRDSAVDKPSLGDWAADPEQLPHAIKVRNVNQSALEGTAGPQHTLARRAFYATLTHIDHQIRLLIGCLREEGILDNTSIIFTADHGHMIGEHGLWCMSPFFEMSAKIPLVVVPPAGENRLQPGTKDDRIAEFGDIMPTLLEICGIPVPDTVETLSLLSGPKREYLYGEIFEGETAMRMIRAGSLKLIYYPAGNRFQLFDIESDPRETRDLSGDPGYAQNLENLRNLLSQNLYGGDEQWIRNGSFAGLEVEPFRPPPNRDLGGQRGLRFM